MNDVVIKYYQHHNIHNYIIMLLNRDFDHNTDSKIKLNSTLLLKKIMNND